MTKLNGCARLSTRQQCTTGKRRICRPPAFDVAWRDVT
jgi:hypothetical protein